MTNTAEKTNQEVITVPMHRWLFGATPWGKCEESVDIDMTHLELGLHIGYCMDMEECHNWKFLTVDFGSHRTYALLDSHGTLYSILTFK